jgi:hypothetical protein
MTSSIFHRLLDRQVSRPFTLGNAAGVSADQAICVGETGAITHQATCCRVFPERINAGNRMAVGQRDQLIALGHEERIGLQEEGARPLRDQIPQRPLRSRARCSHSEGITALQGPAAQVAQSRWLADTRQQRWWSAKLTSQRDQISSACWRLRHSKFQLHFKRRPI